MEWYGVILHGVPSELEFARRWCYREREEPPARPPGCPRRWLDLDLSRADGWALGSARRWYTQRRAKVHYPPGPRDRFWFPPTTSMDYGWGLVDPCLQRNAHFLCAEANFRLPTSDVSRELEELYQHGVEPALLRTRKPMTMADCFAPHHSPPAATGEHSPCCTGTH